MLQKRVTVLRGGSDNSFDTSMKTGASVLQALQKRNYFVQDVVITKNNEWLSGGRIRQPQELLSTTDVVFLALHRAYGTSGDIQKLCESLHIPFTGSNSFQLRVAGNADAAKRTLQASGIKLPKHTRITTDDIPMLDYMITSILRSYGPEYIVKPIFKGLNVNVAVPQEADVLKQTILQMLHVYEGCIVEEKIEGTEATCGVIENFRGDTHYTLPPIEVMQSSQPSEQSSGADDSIETIPARFSMDIREKLAETARLAHHALNLTQYSKTTVILKNNQLYIIDIDPLPQLTQQSHFFKVAELVGMTYEQLIDHLIATARVR